MTGQPSTYTGHRSSKKPKAGQDDLDDPVTVKERKKQEAAEAREHKKALAAEEKERKKLLRYIFWHHGIFMYTYTHKQA